MRILLMVHSLSDGGAERVSAIWADGFLKKGYDVALLLNCNDDEMTYPVSPKIKVYNLGNGFIEKLSNKIYQKSSIDWYFVLKIRAIVKDYKPDVLIGVMQPWAEWGRKAVRGLNIPVINTEHHAFERPETAPMTKLRRRQKFEWNQRYSHVTVLTQADKECIGDLFDTTVLPNPLAFNPADSVPEKEKVILAVGRLNSWFVKGFDTLINSWGEIAHKYPEWKLRIIGHGGEESKKFLKGLADKYQLGEQFELVEFQKNIISFYQESSIFVLSSRFEGFGMVLIEAMSQGCACVACDFKGRQREIIRNAEEGLICDVEDVKGLGASIEKLIIDSNYRQTVQKNAIERSKYYLSDKIANRWDEILKKVLK